MKFTKGSRYKIAPKCPCGKSNRGGKFVPFEGFTDKGYCHSCKKTFLPDGYAPYLTHYKKDMRVSKHIPEDIIQSTMKNFSNTNFFKYLSSLFGVENTLEAFRKYYIGTTPSMDTIYWYKDCNGFGRKGKVFKYDAEGHRQYTYYLNDYTNDKDFYGCIYGEHLLQGAGKDILLVEAEKTAIMASIWYPDLTILATGGANSLSDEKAEVLQGHLVTLLPDADNTGRAAFKKLKQSLIKNGIVARSSDLFPESIDGYDLGDYIDSQLSNSADESEN